MKTFKTKVKMSPRRFVVKFLSLHRSAGLNETSLGVASNDFQVLYPEGVTIIRCTHGVLKNSRCFVDGS